MWAVTLWSHDLLPIQWGAVLSASLVAATTDVVSRRIPNLLTGTVLLTGLIWGSTIGGLAGFADAAAGCLLLAFPFVLLFLFAGGGAGDAKMMGAIGSWLGLVNGAVALVAICVSGLFIALLYAVATRRLRETVRNTYATLWVLVGWRAGPSLRGPEAAPPSSGERQTLPYGLAISTGTILAAAGVFWWQSYS